MNQTHQEMSQGCGSLDIYFFGPRLDVASELKTVRSRTEIKKEDEIIAAMNHINQHKQSRYTETKEARKCHIARTTKDIYSIYIYGYIYIYIILAAS